MWGLESSEGVPHVRQKAGQAPKDVSDLHMGVYTRTEKRNVLGEGKQGGMRMGSSNRSRVRLA